MKIFYGSATNHLELGIWVGWSASTQISTQALCLNDQAYNCLIHFSSYIIVMHHASCKNEDDLKNADDLNNVIRPTVGPVSKSFI